MDIKDIILVLELHKQTNYKYIEEALNIVKKKKLKQGEINLSRDIYPVIAKKFKVTEAAISSAIIRALFNAYYKMENRSVYIDLFGHDLRLTPLKFLNQLQPYLIKKKR